MEALSDFPKLQCPFLRQTFVVDQDDFRRRGRVLNLRKPEVYLVVERINPGYDWVFDDPDTFAVEKLDGTNIKIKTEQGRLVAFQNRKNVIDPLQILSGNTHLIEGLFRSIGKGYVKPDGEQAGELIGPKVNGNPYRLDLHEWYPFDKAITDLRYRSFHEHERTFDNWSAWFKEWLHSRYFTRIASKKGISEKIFAEGVVFYNLKRQEEGTTWMAKLRRDMFAWYYDGIAIPGYTTHGRDEVEDQDGFD
ncbi:MAG: hypothetical protein EA383_08500 [Spirochaetaceae bacterium]|nr:MAG: hypothetical protein EA383_08500 [Spirochaetaceae bacterium]